MSYANLDDLLVDVYQKVYRRDPTDILDALSYMVVALRIELRQKIRELATNGTITREVEEDLLTFIGI